MTRPSGQPRERATPSKRPVTRSSTFTPSTSVPWNGGVRQTAGSNRRGTAVERERWNRKIKRSERYEDRSETVIGALIEVHRALGPGLLESAYEACFMSYGFA